MTGIALAVHKLVELSRGEVLSDRKPDFDTAAL